MSRKKKNTTAAWDRVKVVGKSRIPPRPRPLLPPRCKIQPLTWNDLTPYLELKQGRFGMRSGELAIWANPITGATSTVFFPRDAEVKLAMQHPYWDKIANVIEAHMRKQRLVKRLEEVFNGAFIEDTPVPYLGFKKLNLAGRVVRKEKVVLEPVEPFIAESESSLPLRLPEFRTTPIWVLDEPRFISPWNDQVWDRENGIEARCDSSLHNNSHIPNPMCTCGIYAYDYTTVKNLIMGRSIETILSIVANVIVSMGGYTIPYENGYRSSIGKVEAIISEHPQWSMGSTATMLSENGVVYGAPRTPVSWDPNDIIVAPASLGAAYNVPIIPLREVPQFIRDYTERWGGG